MWWNGKARHVGCEGSVLPSPLGLLAEGVLYHLLRVLPRLSPASLANITTAASDTPNLDIKHFNYNFLYIKVYISSI